MKNILAWLGLGIDDLPLLFHRSLTVEIQTKCRLKKDGARRLRED